MKFFYMNDEHKTVIVQVNSIQNPDPMKWDHIRYERFKPSEGRVIEFDAPEGSIPYLKRWESGQILLTYLPAESDALTRHDENKDGTS